MKPALRDRGHIVAEGLIVPRMADVLYRMLLLRQWRGEFRRDDQIPAAASHWGDSTLDALLLGLRSEIESISGCLLLPTYAYARLYLHGQSLPRHRDRDACEIAVTLHLGSQGAVPPIRFAPPGSAEAAVSQRPGDAVIYLGDRVDHWRETFHGRHFGQLFLNYVRADGERRARLYDGRHHAFPPDALIAADRDRLPCEANA
jgi:hypothetical protein